MKEKFFIFFIFIYGFLLLGYMTRRLLKPLTRYSRPLTLSILIYLTPPIILDAFWAIEFRNVLLTQVPLIYVIIMNTSLLPAFLIAKLMKLGRSETGSLLSCVLFSNIGITLGGFLCFVLFGGRGLYISNLYTAYFMPYYYLVGFPLMSKFSDEKKTGISGALGELATNPASIVPQSAMIAGLLLNLLNIPKPAIVGEISTRWLTYISSAGYSFAIGLGLSLKRSLPYVRHSLYISAVKFFFNPLVGITTVYLFGYHRLEDLVPAKVILIESFMPVAIMSLVLVKIFKLNEDLANSAWVLSTFLVVPVVPVMFVLLKIL